MFPNWQQCFSDPANRREGPATAREAAKDAIRNFVELNWSVEKYPFQIRAPEGWDAHICSRQEGPNEDQPQELKPGQIAITRLQDRPCLAIFELAELIAEIRREAGQEEEADMDSAPGKSQQDQDHGSREEKDDVREAVKTIVRLFLDEGISEEEIMAMVGPATTGNWRIQLGGEIIDRGEPRPLYRQVAAIRSGQLYWSIFDIAEVIAELRQEVRCLYCNSVLDNQPKGRTRKFCENKGKCKQAYHRRAKLEERQAAILQEHRDLLDYWQQEHMSDELTTLLQSILLEKGEEAAYDATSVIVAHVERERERWERTRRPQSAPQPEKRPTSRRTRKT
jgi:hypothetical protein